MTRLMTTATQASEKLQTISAGLKEVGDTVNMRIPQRDLRESREATWAGYVHDRGARYQDCRFDNFEILSPKHQAAVDQSRQADINRNMIWLGSSGSGKDHLMTAAIFEAIRTNQLEAERFGEPSLRAIDVLWISGVELFADRRDSMKDISEREFASRFCRADLLAISDPIPPVGQLTEFQMQLLYRIVDYRYSRCKGTWMTINIADKREAQQRLGSQTVDRLRQDAIVIECFWESYRK